MTVTLTLPWPDRALSSNARVHWGARNRATNAARATAGWVATEAGLHKLGPWPNAVLHFTYHPPSRRGDPQNVPHMLKAYIDGIADAMGCDDNGFRVYFPPVFSEPVKGGAVVVTVSPQ